MTTTRPSISWFKRISRLFAHVRGMPGLSAVLLFVTACTAPPSGLPKPAVPPAVDVIAAQAPELTGLSEVVLYLDEVEVLTLRGATDRSVDPPVVYQFYAEATGTRPAGTTRRDFQLRSDSGGRESIHCEVTESEDGEETSVILSADGPLPDLHLLANTERPLLPVRLAPGEPDRIAYAVTGPAVGAFFNGLFDPDEDWAIAMTGRIHCRTAADSVVLTLRPSEPRGHRQTLLTLTSHRGFLEGRFRLAGYPPVPAAPVAAAAAWMPVEIGTMVDAEEPARHTRWMAVNLEPYGADSVLARPAWPRLADRSGAAADSADVVPELGTSSVLETMDVPLSRGLGIASWVHLQETARQIAGKFWAQGICSPAGANLVGVGEPLPIEQARVFVSLVGLAGRTPVMGERMHRLPEERVELLRRIIPALPVRAVDLFPRKELPPLWNLRIVREFGHWDVLGLFNLSVEGRTETISPAELRLADESGRWAVYDFWKERLLGITDDDLTVHLPPGSCRVLAIHRVLPDRPTLLGTSRHITCGGTDLHHVQWDADISTLSGESDVIAGEPYELWILLPLRPDGFDVLEARDETRPAVIRRCGPMRIVTLDADATRRMAWTARFRRGEPLPDEPLAAPDRLAARQNTRGVHLSWRHRDDRTPWYRIYRDGQPFMDVEAHEHQDSTVVYDRTYTYAVAAVDPLGRESPHSVSLVHQTPIPASTNLTLLAPLSVRQDSLELAVDRSVVGTPLRIAGSRLYRGLGTHANSRIVYFLGGGYDLFSAAVGIDDAARDRGSVIFQVLADGEPLYTTPVIRGGERARGFSLRVTGKRQLELLVTDAGDGADFDFADWGNPYLRVLPR